MSGTRGVREQWRAELAAGPDCPPIERLGEELTPAEREHVQHCLRCEAELALLLELRDGPPIAEEADAVRWVAAEVRRRRAAPVRGWRFMAAPSWRVLAAAAAVLVAVALGTRQLREPALDTSAGGPDIYRSTRLEVLAPLGELAAPPAELNWRPVAGASAYEVEVFEVDHNVLWRASAHEPRAALPAAVATACVPGKTVLWRVTARAGAAVLAESGTQRFRVRVGRAQE